MAEVADLLMRAAVQGGREAVVTLDQIDAAAKKAEASADRLTGAEDRLERQLKQADAALKQQQAALQANVVHFDAYYQAASRDFHGQWVKGARQFVDATDKAGKGARLASHEMVNLGRQMADLGTMAAMGASPMMLIASQGPQIADIFGTASARGVKFGDALKGIALQARAAAVAFGPLAAAATALGVILWAGIDAFREMGRQTEAVTDATKGFNSLTAQAEEAVNGLAIATWKLADARKEATRQAIQEQIVANNAEIHKIKNPSLWNRFGNSAVQAGANALLPGARIGDALAAERAAAAQRNLSVLQQQNATLMRQNIGLVLDNSRDAASAYEALIPRLREVEKIERQRSALQTAMRGGAEELAKAGLTEAQAREAIAAADKKIAELRISPEQKKALSEAARLAEAEAKRRQATIEAANEGIQRLRDEVQEIGRTAEAVRALGVARQAAEAPLESQRILIRQLGEEREAALKLAAAWEWLNKQHGSNGDRTMSARQKVEAEGQERLNDAIAQSDGLMTQLELQTRLQVEVDNEWAKALEHANAELKVTPDHLNEAAKGIETTRERAERLADAFADVRYSLDDMFSSMRQGDLGGFMLNIRGMISGIGEMMKAGPAGVLSLGSVAANAIGGRGGRAVGGGLGIAASGLFAGSQLMGAASMGMLGSGAMAGMAMSLAPILGPIGLAAGALYAAAKLFNVGGKPTNAGAGVDLVSGALSGSKRTKETEEAAIAAADSIKAIQDALRQAGVELPVIVNGLVLGTRDQTQIYLSNGETLRSAVGDSGAAVDAAFEALMGSAKYASEAQERVAKAALAAGGGFEAVVEALAKYEQAQAISGSLSDRILQSKSEAGGLPDYELEMFRRGIADERKAYQGLADEGFLTTEKLADIFAQLTEIESLGVAAIMKQFAGAVTSSTELLKQRRSMEAELLRLQGDEVGARAVERALALAELDAGLHELQKQIWNTADALEAAAIMNQGRSMTAELLRIQGFEEQATAIERALALEALPEALRALQVDIWRAGDGAAATTKHFEALDAALSAANDNLATAQNAVRDAYEREAGAIRDHVDEMEAAARSLRDFRRELDVGALAGRDPLSQYARTKAEFDRLNAMAANDPQRLANLQSVSQAFLEASRAASPTQMAFDRDLNAVRRATEASELAAQKEVDVGRAQLEALTTQVSQLMQLNATAMTVAQSLSFLKDAMVQQAVAQAASAGNPYGTAANDNAFDPARYLAGNKDIGRYALANGLDPVEFARQHWLTAGQYEVAAGLRGYATGGSFMVGGAGGTDSQLVQFMASPDERVDILTPAQQRGGDDGELAAELREQNRLLAEQNALLRRIDHSTDQAQSKLKDFDQGGMYVRGKAPDDPVETQEAA